MNDSEKGFVLEHFSKNFAIGTILYYGLKPNNPKVFFYREPESKQMLDPLSQARQK